MGGKVLGVVNIADDRISAPFSEAEVRLLALFGDEAAIALQNTRLLERLQRASVDLAVARDEAVQASKLKSEFLAVMSHELRTPLNVIIGLSALLVEPDLGERRDQYAETIRRSSEDLLRIISDLLDFSKIAAGKLDLELAPFDLGQCLQGAFDMLQPAALAGARALALGSNYPTAITNSLANNKAGLKTWSLTTDAKGVHLENQATLSTWLARALGIKTLTVSAASEAEYMPVKGSNNLLPMTFCSTDVTTTGERVVMQWADSTKTSGAFGWLTWNGLQDTGTLRTFVENPSLSGKWKVGDIVQASSGTSCNPVESDVKAWIGKTVVVPVYKAASGAKCAPTGTGSNTKFPIVGFAVFTMEGFTCKNCPYGGSSMCMWGHFSKALMKGDVDTSSGSNFGVMDLRVVK